MKNTSNHPETENPAHASLSFDGCGINGRDEYRTRITTFTNKRGPVANHYGPLFAAAPELLAALERSNNHLSALLAIQRPYLETGTVATLEETLKSNRAEIARAKAQK